MVPERRWKRPASTTHRPLFDGVPARPNSPTSVAAAKSISHAKQYIEQRIIEHVRECGAHGATAEEVAAALALRTQTCSARCSELREAGRLVDSRSTRPTSSGRKAMVLVCPQYGGAGCTPSAA